MLPDTLVVRTEHKLLRQGVHLLILVQLQIVGRHIVLIHQHGIVEILVAGGGGEEQALRIIADAHTCIEHVTLITVHDGCGRILHICICWHIRTAVDFRQIIERMEFTIGKAILIHILIVGCPVELQLRCRLPDQAYLTTCLVGEVVLLLEVIVVDKAFQSTIKASHRKSELV